MPDFETTQALLLEMLQQQRRDSALLSSLLGKIDKLDDLYNRVFIGNNGQPSLVADVTQAQHDILSLLNWRVEREKAIAAYQVEAARGHWLLLAALLTGVSGIIVAAISWLGRLWK